MKKIFLSSIVFILVFAAAAFLRTVDVEAALSAATGSVWGGSENTNDGAINGNETGIGWVSMNSADSGMGGGASYVVNIPDTDGPVTGYGWSDTLKSYIDFAPHAGCPTEKYPGSCDAYPTNGGQKMDVTRQGDRFVGWARVVNIAVANKSGASNGEDGWISMDPPDSSYSVFIDPATGFLSGYAWAGGSLGALSFSSVKGPISPVVTITANPTFVDIMANPNWSSTGVPITLTWEIAGVSSCVKNWDGAVVSANGTATVNQTAASRTYTLTCTGSITKSVTVTTGCEEFSCANQKCEKNYIIPTTDVTRCKRDCSEGGGECEIKSIGSWKEVAP